MATQKFMGTHKLVKRLTAQVGSEAMAIALLKERGDMNAKGELTKAGKVRDSMTAKERAVDRAVKKTGRAPQEFKYNRSTNRATLKE